MMNTLKQDLGRTMRIELDEGEHKIRQNGDTVKILLPDQGVGTTSFQQSLASSDQSASLNEYQRLLQSVYDAVLITDADGLVREFNHRAVTFFRYPESELLGMRVPRLIAGADDAVIGTIRKNLIEHRYTLIEGTCRRRDGSSFPSEIAVNRLDTKQEGRLCFFVRDISVRKRAQDALEEAILKLEQHDRNRSQFISNVSHELRTPLTSMIYAINNMLRGVTGALNEDQSRYLEMLLGDSRRLLATVNDILDLRKIENQTLTLVKTRMPFGRMVQGSACSLQVQAEQKGIHLDVQTGSKLWFVNCDAQKIERVILNLVGNALKFTSEGGHVWVQLVEDPDVSGHVRVVVDDDGVGIPPKDLDRVTERYYTVGDQPSGSGLGLAISKEIVELHAGCLRVESPPPGLERGTRIWFRLPVAPVPSVLIVDDETRVCEKLSRQVAQQGYRVLCASSGEQALQRIEQDVPDVVVLDMSLPDMEGSEVIIRLKGDAATGRIPILAMTGAPLGRNKEDILRNFGISIVSKPWNETELLDGIANAFLGGLPFAQRA
ncbi:MAG: ATP-binding protein [Kiritimatiellia bacterium]